MERTKSIIVNICRFVLALTFIFSGYVKAIDPLGTQYKLHDYAEAAGEWSIFGNQFSVASMAPDWLTLTVSVALSATEFCLGIFLLFAIRRRLVSRLMVVFMAVMTLVTLWLFVANPIEDCGCFGDALKLTNGQTLLKNLVLLACAVVVAWQPLRMVRFIYESTQWIVINYTIIFILASSLWSLYTLPPFDFRPYHIGASIPKGMEIPEDAPQPQFETTFILEKDGKQQEFSLDNYPDSTWTFVDSKSVEVVKGYVPPIHDFSIVLNTALTADSTAANSKDDITESVLADEGYTFLLISPHLEQADDANFGDIDLIFEYAEEHHYPFYCLTASTDDAINRWIELTGAEYPFCNSDETTLKTIIRSNPGLVLLKEGVIMGKWSHNDLPSIKPEETTLPIDELKIAQLTVDEKTGKATIQPSTARKISTVLLWFALPLVLLTLADRTWAWTKWVRREKATSPSAEG